jgi:hypothetical protein
LAHAVVHLILLWGHGQNFAKSSASAYFVDLQRKKASYAGYSNALGFSVVIDKFENVF